MENHPRLYVTKEQIERAKERIKSEQWAKEILADLIKKADEALSVKLPVYETDWWQEARKKHWSEFYPEIWKHCNMVPMPPVHSAHSAALAYLLTGEEKYAVRAKEILLHTTAFTFEFEHPDVGMHYSSLSLFSLQAFDMLADRFSPDETAKMRDFFNRGYAAVRKDDDWWVENNPGGMFNNHFAWHKLWIGAYGLYFDRDDLLNHAVESDQGIRELLEHGLMDEGAWFESSLNYHFTAVWALVKMAQMLRNSGCKFDLFTHRFANGRTMKQLFDGILLNAFPDTSLPTIGDAYGAKKYLSHEPLFGLAFNAYGDPAYDWLISKGGKRDIEWLFWEKLPSGGKAPAMYTQLFPEHGHAMLRTVEGDGYWDSDGFNAFVSYDINSVHSHNDKLDLILFGRGKLLLADPEALASAPHAFSAQVQKELNRTTICHNTVMVDRKEQGSTSEKLTLLDFKNLPDLKMVSAADLDGRVYPGVKMKRTVAAASDHVLDVFQIKSEEEHTYQWLLHPCDDEGLTGITLDMKPVKLPDASPWDWLRNAFGAVTDEDVHAEWIQGDLTLHMVLLGSPSTKITVCEFPRTDTFDKPPYPMFIAERIGKSATFIALYQAERGAISEADLTVKRDRHGSFRVTVTTGDKASEYIIDRL